MSEIVNSAGRGALGAQPEDASGAALERRLLRIMSVLIGLALLISLPLAPWRVTTGLLLGGVLAFFNHHWLRTSLGVVLGGSAAALSRPRFGAARYVLRYAIVALLVASAYTLNLISLAATLAGLCAFAAAVMVEAFAQLYFAIVHREEN